MKKLLALVLALVMTLSLCVTSNAAYDDAADITHGEAVDVLTTLGVIAGKGDNKFDPAANVTRAEMAKMISIIMLGDVDAAAFVGTSTGLKDIAGHWAEGYIQYCYSQGIIAGKGNNLFDPNANVTAVEAAKMLLGAIGYNAKVQGYEGADWQINVTRDAQISGFYAELKGLAATKALSRDEAAQMIYNTVLADLIVKTPSLNINTGSIEYTYVPNPNKDLMGETFDAVKVEGVVVANEYADLTDTTSPFSALKEGKTQIAAIANADEVGTKVVGTTYNVSTGAEELGKKVVMYVVPSASSNLSTKADVLGKAFLSADNTVATTYAKLKNADKTTSWIKEQGLKLDGDSYAVVNFVGDGFYTAAAKGRGVKLTIIDNDADGTVDVVFTQTKSLDKITLINTAKEYITLNSGATVDNDDLVIYDGAAKNDIVMVYTAGGKTYVEKPTTITGTISKYNSDADVVIDGTTYSASALANNSGKDNLSSVYENTFDAGTFYLDDANNVIAADLKSTVTSANTCYVADTDIFTTFTSTQKVYAYLADGTKGVYDVASYNGSTKTSVTSTVTDGLYIYELTDNGLALRDYNADSLSNNTWAQTTDADAGDLALDKDVAQYSLTGVHVDGATGTSNVSFFVNNDTIFYLHDTGVASVGASGYLKVVKGISGLSATATTYGDTMVAYKTDTAGNKIALAVYGTAGSVNVSTAADLVFVVSADWTKNGDNYDVDVVFSGKSESETITIETAGAAVGLYTYSKDAKDIYTLTPAVTTDGAHYGALKNVSDTWLYVDEDYGHTFDADEQFNKLGAESVKVFDVTDGKATETSVSFLDGNIYGFVAVDDDGNVVAVYVVGKYEMMAYGVNITAGLGTKAEPFVLTANANANGITNNNDDAYDNVVVTDCGTDKTGTTVVAHTNSTNFGDNHYFTISGKDAANHNISTVWYEMDLT